MSLEYSLTQNFSGIRKFKMQSQLAERHQMQFSSENTSVKSTLGDNNFNFLLNFALQYRILAASHFKAPTKKKHLAASASPLKLTTNNYNYMISFNKLHCVNQRATPKQIIEYKHALFLNRVYNNEIMNNELLSTGWWAIDAVLI